jgi:hypothetical protein
MKEVAIQERIRLMEKEMDLLGESMDRIKMDFKEQMAALRIELDTLKACLIQVVPEFKTQYPRIKKLVREKVDPDRTT